MAQITTVEVSARYGLHRRQILRLVKTGKLTARKTSAETGTYLFDEDKVAAEMSELSRTPQDAA